MLRVFSEGDSLYRLEDAAGAHVGTIRNRTIGFRGFASERDARDGAIAAWHAMTDALRREYPSWPRYELALDRLTTTHDGAYEWFYDGTMAIARLLRPRRVGREHSFGIELVPIDGQRFQLGRFDEAEAMPTNGRERVARVSGQFTFQFMLGHGSKSFAKRE